MTHEKRPIKECCQDPANLEEQESGKPDLTLRVCRMCGCRHFELTVDPGKFGVTGVTLGGAGESS